VRPEPAIRDGRMELPAGAGLGVELDEDALARYRVDQPRVTGAR
jgi:L-alanine-DL-glutamate epimerase-like enolase superfamily enzyme